MSECSVHDRWQRCYDDETNTTLSSCLDIDEGYRMSSEQKPITGGCLCGAIRYEVSEPLSGATICHCRDCQKSTGSAFLAVAWVSQAAFQFTSGDPTQFISKKIIEKYFCPRCGSQLTDRYLVPVSAALQTHMVWVHVGTLDDPELVAVKDHFGVESQLSWVRFDDGLPRARCDEEPGLVAAITQVETR